MIKTEREKLLEDQWPKKYPKGKKALLNAIEKASKAGLFDLEEKNGHLKIKEEW